MRRVLWLAVFLAACPSPRALCESGVDQVCERVFECQSEAVKSAAAFQAAFGVNESDCKAKLYANPTHPQGATGIACIDAKDDAALCANLGRAEASRFELGKARECRDARARLSCADYLAQLSDPSKAPATCGERCQ